MGRAVMGWSLLANEILVLSGLDKQLEAWLLDIAPAWLAAMTTQF
jgi:cytochrome c-type biogenesis protein